MTNPTEVRDVRFLQSNSDRRQIFAVATGGRPAEGFGPLDVDQVGDELYTDQYPAPYRPVGDAALAADLMARSDEFHPLDDFFHFYGYPPDVIAWIEATELNTSGGGGWYTGGGREAAEVAERLGLDEQRLRDAGMDEGIVPGAYDPAGDPLYQHGFGSNWAVADPSGRVTINPNARRFKAWLSLET